MKKKNLKQRLALNKNTIANLEMQDAKGGATGACTPGCHTFNLTNCESWEYPICQCVGGTGTCP